MVRLWVWVPDWPRVRLSLRCLPLEEAFDQGKKFCPQAFCSLWELMFIPVRKGSWSLGLAAPIWKLVPWGKHPWPGYLCGLGCDHLPENSLYFGPMS